jgi:hypothetical protein
MSAGESQNAYELVGAMVEVFDIRSGQGFMYTSSTINQCHCHSHFVGASMLREHILWKWNEDFSENELEKLSERSDANTDKQIDQHREQVQVGTFDRIPKSVMIDYWRRSGP